MVSQTHPEAVRGTWYYVPEDFELADGLKKPHQILAFRVDGSFTRYQVKNERRKVVETGDYTYDGNFLILRGRSTDTFRVRRPFFWRWELEGKKKDQHLLRALVAPHHLPALSESQARDLRILPLRARIHADHDGDDLIYRMVFTESEEPILLGTFFVEPHTDGHRWIGLTPLVQGVEPKTWERIIRDSFLDLFCGKPDDITVVTIRLLDDDSSRVFNYAAG